jgi:Fe-S-cluster containining protein
MPTYECDRCGACCKGYLLVEVYDLDVLREPKLATADTSNWYAAMTQQQVMAELEQEGKCLIIAGGQDRPCKFLGGDNLCTIYPTRPNVCVAMEAGDDQCQNAREQAGLPPLEPTRSE